MQRILLCKFWAAKLFIAVYTVPKNRHFAHINSAVTQSETRLLKVMIIRVTRFEILHFILHFDIFEEYWYGPLVILWKKILTI